MKSIELDNTALAELLKKLALFMQSGIQISDGMHILSKEEKDEEYSTLLTHMALRLEEGEALSEVFLQAGCFGNHIAGLLEMAERVGRTEETLLSLARYYEDKARRNRQLKNALTYPCILLVLMTVVVVILLTKVLPIFQDVYASLGGSFTGMAKGLLEFGNLLNQLLPFFGIIVAVLVLSAVAVSVIPAARTKVKELRKFLNRDTGISRIINNANFAQALAMAVSSGMPMEEGIALAGKMFRDCPQAQKRCEDCMKRMDEGEELEEALRDTHMLPESDCYMLKLGMRAGNGDEIMRDIAEKLSEDANEAIANKAAQIEPALVLFTSFLTGAILLTVMLPLINIMKVIG